MNLKLIVIINIYLAPITSFAYFIDSDYLKNTSCYYYSLNEIKKEESIISYKKEVIENSFLDKKTFANLLTNNLTQLVDVCKTTIIKDKSYGPYLKQQLENMGTKTNSRLIKSLKTQLKLAGFDLDKMDKDSCAEKTAPEQSNQTRTHQSRNKQDADKSCQLQKYYTKISFMNSTEISVVKKLWVLINLLCEKKVNFLEQYKNFSLSAVSLGVKYNFLTYKDFLFAAACGVKYNTVENNDAENVNIFFARLNLDLYNQQLKTTNFSIIANIPFKKYDPKSQEPYLSFSLDHALNKRNISWGISFKNESSLSCLLYSEKKNKLKLHNYLALGKSFYYSENTPIGELELGLYYSILIEFKQTKPKPKDWGMSCAFIVYF